MMTIDTFFKDKIAQAPCSFADFMQMVLYDPQYGYYTTKDGILGQSGDFVTAPEMGSLFGRMLAKQIQAVITAKGSSVLEFGAGRGYLCLDILSYLKNLDALPEKYFILDVSANLKQAQYALIQSSHPEFLERIEWITTWPDKFSGVVLANEVLDAMPVHRFLWKNAEIYESMVEYSPLRDCLEETFVVSKNQDLRQFVKDLALDPALEYCSEVNLGLKPWLSGLYASLEQALVLLIDYGFPRQEYYHPDRYQGTLMCHLQHRAHTDFLSYLGQQDITAHVDFTLVAESAYDLGFEILGYTHQAGFLLASGILAEISTNPKQIAEAKILLQSHEMGEIFKIMALGKQLNIVPQGFQMFDKRMSL